MKPQFENYRGDRKDLKDSVTARIPSTMKTKLELLAAVEGDNLTGLIIEGLARVIEDREHDPNLAENIQRILATQASELESQLAQNRALQSSFPNSGL